MEDRTDTETTPPIKQDALEHPGTRPADIPVQRHLRDRNITPTRQRVEIARVLLAGPIHLSADDVYDRVAASGAHVSRATVYNTLSLFVDQKLIRQVIVDPSRVFYDSNTKPHHHFYDTESGELTDIPTDQIDIAQLPTFPEGKTLAGVEVIVRLRDAP